MIRGEDQTERKTRSIHEKVVKKSDAKDMEEVIKLIRKNKIREKSGELFHRSRYD